MTFTLEFHGGPMDGHSIQYDSFDDLPDQDAFAGYWIEDVVINDRLAAVPLWRATPNGKRPFAPPEDYQ